MMRVGIIPLDLTAAEARAVKIAEETYKRHLGRAMKYRIEVTPEGKFLQVELPLDRTRATPAVDAWIWDAARAVWAGTEKAVRLNYHTEQFLRPGYNALRLALTPA